MQDKLDILQKLYNNSSLCTEDFNISEQVLLMELERQNYICGRIVLKDLRIYSITYLGIKELELNGYTLTPVQKCSKCSGFLTPYLVSKPGFVACVHCGGVEKYRPSQAIKE